MNSFIAPKHLSELPWKTNSQGQIISAKNWVNVDNSPSIKGVQYNLITTIHENEIDYIIYELVWLKNSIPIRHSPTRNKTTFINEAEATRWLFNELEKFYEKTSAKFNVECLLKTNALIS